MEIRLYQFNGHLNDVIKDQSTLTHLVTLTGELRNSLSVIDPVIVVDFSSTANITFAIQSDENNFMDNIFKWNYAYISAYRRYYFIRNITLVSKNIIAFQLHVDVLKTYRFYITEQHAYITRNENEYNIMLPDERRVIKNTFTVSEHVPSNVPNSLVNTTFKTDFVASTVSDETGVFVNNMNVIVVTYPKEYGQATFTPRFDTASLVHSPVLNRDINSGFEPNSCFINVYNIALLEGLLRYFYANDVVRSFLVGIFVYPFTMFKEDTEGYSATYPNRVAPRNLVVSDQDVSFLQGARLYNIISREIVIADFMVNSNSGIIFDVDDFNDLEPYSQYELYIPYYGWWTLPFNSVRGKRIIISYVVNFKTGSATINVTNYTDQIIIFSTNCQLGVEIGVTTTNLKEVKDRERQNNTNLALSLIGSAIAIGGTLTGNPIAIGMGLATGGLTIGKSLTQYTETERTNYSRATIQYGSGISPLYGYQQVKIRKTKRDIQYQLTNDFLNFNGGVLNEERSHLYDVTGYTEIGDITFENIEGEETPLQDELNEIISLLKSGVYL